MASSEGLLVECVQQLKASSHDYEKLLGSSVESVWRTLATSVERQLRLHKGVGVSSLGKFSFVRDLQPLTPVFLLADRFISSYGVAWRRPPPALLTPVTELNLSAIGNDAGGLPKDQVVKTLDALLAFVGKNLQKGTASGRLRFGNVGCFVFDGKAASFQFDAALLKAITTAPSVAAIKILKQFESTASTKSEASKGTTTIPRAVSLQVLAPVETRKPPPIAEEHGNSDATSHEHNPSHHHHRDGTHRRSHHHHRKKDHFSEHAGEAQSASNEHRLHRDRHAKSASALITSSTSTVPTSEGSGQILPRFMLPDPSRSPSKFVYAKQAASMQRTFEFKRDEMQLQQAAITRQDDEIERRTHATRLRCVQERAEKTVNQRDLDTFLSMQIESKHRAKLRQDAVDATSTNFDAVRVLPRDPIVTVEQRQAAKLKLRGRLHDQVTLRDTLTKQRHAVDRAESAYFMTKVLEQGQIERSQRDELKRMAREAVTSGWQQQRAIKHQCEQLQQAAPRSELLK